jgi:predicted transcriptional regulator
LERAVLQVLWDRPSPVAAKDVLAALGDRDRAGAGAPRELAITTVLTVLDRLRRKGLVRRERSGRAHLIPGPGEPGD